MNYERDIKTYIDEILETTKKKNQSSMLIYLLCFGITILMFVLLLIQSFNTGITGNTVALTLSFVAIVLVMMQIYFTNEDNSREKVVCLLIFGIYATLNNRGSINKKDKELYKKILSEISDSKLE
ncbi:hypothetical protein R9X47_01315 [Wukongibacter baidiensis]|uniref:hypothetical protein n=1 Tax=Wukongibacter baidiensis TaxID=1723361 RepID=UPI003D7F5433